MQEISKDRLVHIIGGTSDNPGTNYWIGGNNNHSGGSGSGSNWGSHLGNKIAICIAYGLAGRRGPFGCDS